MPHIETLCPHRFTVWNECLPFNAFAGFHSMYGRSIIPLGANGKVIQSEIDSDPLSCCTQDVLQTQPFLRFHTSDSFSRYMGFLCTLSNFFQPLPFIRDPLYRLFYDSNLPKSLSGASAEKQASADRAVTICEAVRGYIFCNT